MLFHQTPPLCRFCGTTHPGHPRNGETCQRLQLPYRLEVVEELKGDRVEYEAIFPPAAGLPGLRIICSVSNFPAFADEAVRDYLLNPFPRLVSVSVGGSHG